MSAPIYMDYNATTPLLEEAHAAVLEAMADGWGNPSSHHWAGKKAKEILDRARTQVASLAGASPEEVLFTSGATEAINLVVRSVQRGRILASVIEHPAVLEAAEAQHDVALEKLPVDARGCLLMGALDQALDAGESALVAVMAANNETGVIQPLSDIASRVAAAHVPLLVDATQYIGKMALPIHATFTVFTGHKLGGPKGAGALITRERRRLQPQILGGGQEWGRRGGTEALPAIAGFGAAAAAVLATRERETARIGALRDTLQTMVLEGMPGARIVGVNAPRLPNTLSLMLPHGIEAEAAINHLNRQDIAVSAGSACHSGSPTPSRVLRAMNITPAECFRVLRISLGPGNTLKEVERVGDALLRLGRQLSS